MDRICPRTGEDCTFEQNLKSLQEGSFSDVAYRVDLVGKAVAAAARKGACPEGVTYTHEGDAITAHCGNQEVPEMAQAAEHTATGFGLVTEQFVNLSTIQRHN